MVNTAQKEWVVLKGIRVTAGSDFYLAIFRRQTHTCIKDSTNQVTEQTCFHCGPWEVPVTSLRSGGRVRWPYLWGHSANGGQVIASAQEVWSVDLQLKVAQPLDNGL